MVGKVSHFDLWLLSIWQLMALQQIGSNIRSSDMTREGRFNNIADVVMPAKSFHLSKCRLLQMARSTLYPCLSSGSKISASTSAAPADDLVLRNSR